MGKKELIKNTVAVSAIAICLSLTGCSQFDSKIPNLNDEEEALVVEYASETLLKYDKHAGDKIGRQPEDFIINKSVIEGTVGELEPTPAPTPEPSLDIEIPDDGNETAEGITDNTSEENTVSSIEDVISLPSGVSIKYSGFEVTDHYPDEAGDYFVLTASEGKRLLLLKFEIVNNSSENTVVNFADAGIKFKIMLNDGKARNALTTMLLNDFAFYNEELMPQETKEVVIVGEYPGDEISSVTSIGLRLKKDNQNFDIKMN